MFPQEASPNNPISSMLNQFPISFSTNHFENQIFDAYETDLRGNCTLYPNSVSPLQSIQSLGERISSCINPVHAPPLVSQEQEINHDPHLLNIVEACNQGVDQMSSDYCFVGSELGSFSTSINQSFETAVFNSKYLKPAQSLLHEVVNVGGQALDSSNEKYVRKLASSSKRGSLVLCSALKAQLCDNGGSNEKNELHFKVSKLIALLEEVERRYEKFHIQMEELVSSFEAIAGEGAGKLYTAFTLQAISRHFSSLRDVTLKEIFKNIPQIKTGLSRFNPFDPSDQMGLSRTSQQTWRPFRGLPDTSVAILRSWIFEHFLNPYPNEPEKLSLAMQTGLSKKQISNWFINARVRVWKPMIEEIYREEFDYSNPVVESCSYTMGGALNHAC